MKHGLGDLLVLMLLKGYKGDFKNIDVNDLLEDKKTTEENEK